jgi:TRAP-type C4-dicarboxylate transport system substrate-binding protein
VLLAALAFAIASSGCGGGTKSGGRAVHDVVLTIATRGAGDSESELTQYAAAVDRSSGGSIHLVLKENWRSGDSDPVRRTVADVRAGRVDLAEIDVRSYDRLGVHGFDAVVAPFLIDRLSLEKSLLASRLPRRMLATAAPLDVEGIAMLPGPLEHPFGLEQRLVSPADYHGAVIGTTPTPLARRVFGLLHAVARGYRPAELPPWRYAGAELDLVSLAEGGRYPVYGKSSVTTNLAFWPAASTIIGNRKVLARLTVTDRRIIVRAARESLGLSVAQLQAEDRSALQTLCRRDHVALAQASRSNVSALLAAVRPVYTGLERDALTRSAIEQIEKLKRAAPPDARLGCATLRPRNAIPTPIDGTWVMSASRARAGQLDAGDYRMVLRRGRTRTSFTSPYSSGWRVTGIYSIRGQRIFFEYGDGTSAVYTWNVFRDALTLRMVPGVAEAPNPTFAAWHRAG